MEQHQQADADAVQADPVAKPRRAPRSMPAWLRRPPRGRGPSLWYQVALLALIAALIAGATRHPATGEPAPIAAIVNGLPVTMASYTRQLRFTEGGYSGPRAPSRSPTGRTIERLLQDQAIAQAIAEVLIDHDAAAHGLQVDNRQVAQEVARMSQAAGGPGGLRREMRATGMSMDDVRWVARHTLLRNRLAILHHDPAWLDHLVATARITYYVGDGAVGPDRVPAIVLGHPAPPFVALDLAGHAVSLADLAGRPVVLNFWASWCGACRDDLAMLSRFARAHPGVAVVALDRQENAATVRAYNRQYKLRGVTLWLDTSAQAAAAYTVGELPVTFFIDRGGILRSYNFGPLVDPQSLAGQADSAKRGVNNTY